MAGRSEPRQGEPPPTYDGLSLSPSNARADILLVPFRRALPLATHSIAASQFEGERQTVTYERIEGLNSGPGNEAASTVF